MPCYIVVGTQWGDEGKGKIVDFLATEMDVVVRAQGGHNAGHTVIIEDKEYKLHLIPSGILSSHTKCYLASGVVLDLRVLNRELNMLQSKGIDVSNRLFFSEGAHLVFPYHQTLDRLSEEKKKKGAIGTTLSGIGPAYADKINRIGIRLGDLRDSNYFYEKLKQNLAYYNELFVGVYQSEPLELEPIYEAYIDYFKSIQTFVCSWENWALYDDIEKGRKILFEGAQGTYLDITYGTYPFVTSSNTIASGICTGAGVGPRSIDVVLGIAKAYSTRVGAGPMPTAFDQVEGFPFQSEARELGTTTGRLRRMGWIDLPLIKQAVQLNSLNELALTKIDILDRVKVIKLAVGYRYEGQVLHKIPQNISIYEKVEPIYEEMPGWLQKTSDLTSFDQLPVEAKAYIKRIETFCGCPITWVSVGPMRSQTLKRESTA